MPRAFALALFPVAFPCRLAPDSLRFVTLLGNKRRALLDGRTDANVIVECRAEFDIAWSVPTAALAIWLLAARIATARIFSTLAEVSPKNTRSIVSAKEQGCRASGNG
jgi:hypothetical protein